MEKSRQLVAIAQSYILSLLLFLTFDRVWLKRTYLFSVPTYYRINEIGVFLCCRNLAIGIGIQNFPEGLAVSLPLQAAGISTMKSFCYGQLSGMVEPLAGVLGAAGVSFAEPALPYALAFAAGAMIYVVIDDIVPEAHQRLVWFLTRFSNKLRIECLSLSVSPLLSIGGTSLRDGKVKRTPIVRV